MARSDLDVHLSRIERLVNEISQFVPVDNIAAAQFRSDLAGLLVVSMAASYENCVKETLISYAARQHVAFERFAAANYKKLNSKVNLGDLNKYAKDFDENVHHRFRNILSKRKERINGRLGKNIDDCYTQILNWRHSFAHTGIQNTTIEEAIATHRMGKRVLYCFDQAFNGQ